MRVAYVTTLLSANFMQNFDVVINMEHWWNDTDSDTETFGEITAPVPFCPPQIPREQTWDRTSTHKCHILCFKSK
jgi:hypothetical protein